jgi:hypothetical protein
VYSVTRGGRFPAVLKDGKGDNVLESIRKFILT